MGLAQYHCFLSIGSSTTMGLNFSFFRPSSAKAISYGFMFDDFNRTEKNDIFMPDHVLKAFSAGNGATAAEDVALFIEARQSSGDSGF